MTKHDTLSHITKPNRSHGRYSQMGVTYCHVSLIRGALRGSPHLGAVVPAPHAPDPRQRPLGRRVTPNAARRPFRNRPVLVRPGFASGSPKLRGFSELPRLPRPGFSDRYQETA